MSVLTVVEPRTYAANSPHSYYRDLLATMLPQDAGKGKAQERLDRHAKELSVEIEQGTPEGLRARRLVHEATRTESERAHRDAETAELRAMSSGTGSGGSFVTPYYLYSQQALALDNPRVFSALCTSIPMPEWGLELFVPSFQSGASVEQQSEGTAITPITDPTTSYQAAPVQTQTGLVAVSQQLLDRGVDSTGATFDMALSEQMQVNLGAKVDTYALGVALLGASAIAGQSSFTFGGFYQDVASAREAIATAPGPRIRATHVLTTDNLHGYVTRQLDGQGRPIVVPAYAPGPPPAATSGDQSSSAYARFTGNVLPGALLWFTDDAIPASGNGTQIVVSRPSTLLLAETEPVFVPVVGSSDARVLNLQVDCILREYVACVNRHPTATAVVTGSAYGTALA